MKFRPVEAVLFHVDGETEGRHVTKLAVAFHYIANMLKDSF